MLVYKKRQSRLLQCANGFNCYRRGNTCSRSLLDILSSNFQTVRRKRILYESIEIIGTGAEDLFEYLSGEKNHSVEWVKL